MYWIGEMKIQIFLPMFSIKFPNKEYVVEKCPLVWTKINSKSVMENDQLKWYELLKNSLFNSNCKRDNQIYFQKCTNKCVFISYKI